MIFDVVNVLGHCRRHHQLEGIIEKWKRDYVYVLQSSITVPTGDLTDGMSVSLYGGNRVSQIYYTTITS